MSLRSAATMFSRLGGLGRVAAMTFSPLTGVEPGLFAAAVAFSRLGGPGMLGTFAGPGALPALGAGSCGLPDVALA